MGYDLYDGRPPSQPRDTSRQAAEDIEPSVGRLQRVVLDHLTECGDRGATDYEMELALSLSHQTVSARRRELVQKALVMDSGMRRKTERSTARVWVVAPDDYEGDSEEPGTSGKKTKAAPPSAAVIKKALQDLRGMQNVALKSGFRFDHPDESAALGRWLKKLSEE